SNGTYTVDVVDGSGCTGAQATVEIFEALSGTVVVTNASCNDGSIEVFPVGGDGNYVYSVVVANDPVPADGTFNNTNPITLSGNTYDVYIRDNNGLNNSATDTFCQYVIEDVVVAATPVVNITPTANQPICNGDLGSIDIAISDGESPYDFTVFDSLGGSVANIVNHLGNSISFNDLPADTYDITITDELGCSQFVQVTLDDPVALVMDIDPILPPGCAIDPTNTGIDFINIDPNDYLPYTLQYSIDNGATWIDFTDTNGQVRNLNSGDIIFPVLRISDGTGGTGNTRCILSYGQYEIPYNVEGLIVNPVANPGTCSGGFSVTVEAINGVGPFEFAIDSASGWIGPDVPGGNTATFSGLTPGQSYDFFVRDASGCIEQNNEDLYADFTPSVLITSTVNNAECNAASNGTITFSIDNTSGDLTDPFDWTLYKRDASNNGVAVAGYTNITQNGFADITVTGLDQGEYYIELTNTSGIVPFCQFASADVLIQEGTPISGNLAVVNNITCSVDGSVRIENVNGGFPGYTYTASVYETGTPANTVVSTLSGNIVSVAASDLGAYTSVDVEVLVTDTNGCTTNLGPVTLTLSPSPTIDSVVTDTCDTNKTITVTVSGGTAPYQYSTDGGATFSAATTNTTYTFNSLTAGSYDVVVQDANGCSDNQNSVIIYPSLNYTLTTGQNLNCSPGEAVVDITVDSGAALGVTGDFSYVITAVAPPAVTPATNTGTITGAATSTSHTVTAEGTYEVVLTDNNSGCVVTQQITIAPAIQPDFSAVASVNNICFGSTDGVIQITEVNNSINPLTYSISVVSGGPYSGSIDMTTLTYSGLPAGVYDITGEGTNDCTTTVQVTISQNPDVTLTTTVDEFGCSTGNVTDNAVVNTSAGGGTGTYVRYVFVYDNNTPADTTDDVTQDSANDSFVVTNEAGGSVAVTVYDDNGCIATATQVVAPFNGLSNADYVVTKEVDCRAMPLGGADLNITFDSSVSAINADVTITGSTTSYTDTQSGTSPVSFTGVPADTYTVTITNPITGCVLSTTILVEEAPTFNMDVNKTSDVACVGSNEGSFTFDFSTSSPYTGNYNYDVINNATSLSVTTGVGVGGTPVSITGLAAGVYYVQVTMTDSPFCPVTTPLVTIDEPTAPLALSTSAIAVSCNGGSDGSITATGSDGWGGYTYSLTPVTGTSPAVGFSTNNVFSGLTAGTYDITVRDANGCEEVVTETVPDASLVEFTVTHIDNSCDASLGGSIEVTPTGGTGTYTFTLTNTGTSSVVASGTGTGVYTFTNVGAGDYSVSVVDSNNCPGTALTSPLVTISPDLAFTAIQTKNIDCSVSPDGVITVDITSGSGTYEYSVVNSSSAVIVAQTSTGGTTFTFDVSTADTYTVEVFDMAATPVCSTTVDVVVAPAIQPDFSAVASVNNICFGSTDGVIQITEVNNSINPLTYSISVVSGGPYSGSIDMTTLTYSGLPAGVYDITGEGTNDCTTTVQVTISQNPDVTLTTTVDEFGCSTGNVTDNAVVNTSAGGGTGTYVRYVFVYDNNTPADTTDDITQDSANDSFVVTNEAGGSVAVTVYDDNGCIATATQVVAPFNGLSNTDYVVTKEVDCRAMPLGGADLDITFDSSVSAINADVTITGSTTAYTDTQSGTSPVSFTGVPADTYTVT
ncbi:beta strand repeat-containing protein, partial [Tenacibaculum geojense]